MVYEILRNAATISGALKEIEDILRLDGQESAHYLAEDGSRWRAWRWFTSRSRTSWYFAGCPGGRSRSGLVSGSHRASADSVRGWCTSPAAGPRASRRPENADPAEPLICLSDARGADSSARLPGRGGAASSPPIRPVWLTRLARGGRILDWPICSAWPWIGLPEQGTHRADAELLHPPGTRGLCPRAHGSRDWRMHLRVINGVTRLEVTPCAKSSRRHHLR